MAGVGWRRLIITITVLEATVQRQASLMSFLDAFRLVSTLAVCCLPLIVLAGRSRGINRPAAAAAADSH